MKTRTIKLDEQTQGRLRELGEKMDRTPHWLMKTAIEKYVTEQEKYWQEREEDLDRWNDYLATGDAVPHEDVSVWLESIGTSSEKPCPIK